MRDGMTEYIVEAADEGLIQSNIRWLVKSPGSNLDAGISDLISYVVQRLTLK